MKFIYSFLFLVLLAFPFSTIGHTQEKINLTWTMWSDASAETVIWQKLAEMVSEEHPDITITLNTSSWPDYWTKMPVLVASGQLGDIVGMQSLRLPNFYSILEPLDRRIAADNFDIDAFDSSIIGGMSAQGVVYGLPYDVGPWVVFYNKTLFEARGISLPEPGWTVEEFTKTAVALTDDKTFGFGISPVHYTIFARAIGENYMNTEGEPDLTSPSAIRAAHAMLGLVTQHKAAPLNAAGPDQGNITAGRFDAGNIAMYTDGPWALVHKKNSVDFEIGLVSLPRGEGRALQAVTAGSGFAIPSSSQKKDAAWRAIKTLTGPRALAFLGDEGRALPARTAQQENWLHVAASDVVGAQAAISYSLQHSVPFEITENWNTIELLLNQYFPLAMSGSQTVEQVLATIQNLAQE